MLKQWWGALALVCGFAAAVAAAPQEVERILRIYDVSLLVEPIKDNPGPSLSLDRTAMSGASGGLAFGADEGDLPSHFDPEELVEIIFNNVDPDSWGHAETRCQVMGATLEVVQTPAVHAKIATLLGALRSELGQQLEVRVEFWRVTADVAQQVIGATPGRTGIAAAAEWASLRSAAGVTDRNKAEELVVQLRVGQRSHAAALRDRRFVEDYEVEVAEKTASPDPVINHQRFGAVADVAAQATRDGTKLTLECRLAFAEPGDLQRSAKTDLGLIELPERIVYGCYATATPALGQIWIGACSRPGGQAMLFTVTPTARNVATGAGHAALPKAAGKRTTMAYDLGALTYEAPDFPGERLAGDSFHGGIPGLALEDGEESVRLSEDEVAELIRANLDPDSWEHPRNVLEVRGGAIVVTHTPAMHAKVRAYLAELTRSRVAEVRLESLLVVADAALEKLLAARSGAAVPAATMAQWLKAQDNPLAVVGYASFSVQNRQRSSAKAVRCIRVVADWDTEVASNAKIGDPIIGVVYEGFVGDLQATLAGDGKAVALKLRPDSAVLHGGVRELDTAHGKVHLTDIMRRGTPGSVVLPLGDWGAVGLGRDASGKRLVHLVSARLVR